MSKIKIPYINLSAQWEEEKNYLLPIINDVFSSGQFIGGDIIEKFESNIASFCNSKYCVALNSGTDALVCGLIALGVKRGDEVITPPNSFIASTSSIVHIGAKPIFVDVQDDQNIDPFKIEEAITDKTKAIMPVHLTGRIANMTEIIKISQKYKIPVIEDAAQSIGSKYKEKFSGTFGKIGCFSAHPLKNLNACGDAGFLITDDFDIWMKIKKLRNHGFENRNLVNEFGYVSRMDTLQASILNFRLKKLEKVISKRRQNAKLYFRALKKLPILLPVEKLLEFNSYHTFVIQTDKRDPLKDFLFRNGIETAIHYPVPIHLQPASNYLQYKKGSFKNTEAQADRILTLPIHQFLKKSDINFINDKIIEFFKL